jgi:glycerol-3-phosphate dehydrogenase (NAD(P)+)
MQKTSRRNGLKRHKKAAESTENCKRVVIIGPGHWGRALGHVLTQVFQELFFIGEEASTEDWDLSFADSKPLVIIASPFSSVETVLKELKGRDLFGVINASKGIDRKTLLTFSSLAKKFLKCPFGTLSGPTFAKEVSEGRPTACVLASRDFDFAKLVSRKISHSRFRVYSSRDPIGVEACGAIKNVLAIACGISDGLNLGYNARAALITRGLKELAAIVKILGGANESVFGLAGIGDLLLTATGDLSRNRQFGLYLAEGLKLDEALKKLQGPAEGYYTVLQVHKLAKKYRLDLPICQQVYEICMKGLDPKQAIERLMTRETKSEFKD